MTSISPSQSKSLYGIVGTQNYYSAKEETVIEGIMMKMMVIAMFAMVITMTQW